MDKLIFDLACRVSMLPVSYYPWRVVSVSLPPRSLNKVQRILLCFSSADTQTHVVGDGGLPKLQGWWQSGSLKVPKLRRESTKAVSAVSPHVQLKNSTL